VTVRRRGTARRARSGSVWRTEVCGAHEPNANLDAEGEQALGRTINALKERHCTVVIIGHRPGVLAHTDKILILKDGVQERYGRRDEILGELGVTQVKPARTATPAHG